MKNLLRTLTCMALLAWWAALPAHAQLRASGKGLYDRNNERVVVRGYENSFGIGLSEDGSFIDEMAKTGANAIRILPNLAADQLSLAQVDTLLAKAKSYGMVIYMSPGPDLGPGQTKNEESFKWLERADVFAMLNKYKDHLILDGIQEQDYSDENRWAANCKIAIDRLRGKGYTVPLCMMSSDYGRNHTTVINKAAEVFNYDPLKNTIFNVQAYWDQNWDGPKKYSTALIQEYIPQLAALDYVVQIGICPWAEGAPCDNGNVDYKTAMAECQKFNLGWLIWDWYNPYEWSHVFSVTTNGSFGSWTNLCTYGPVDDCRDNDPYGCDYGFQTAIGHPASVKNTSKVNCFLKGTCGGTTPVAVTGVSVSPATAALAVGGTQQLAATIAPANATNKNVAWSSSNTAVATVSATGLVTAVAAGTATVTATTADGARTAATAVTVTGGTAGGGSGTGLKGEYFANASLSGTAALTRTDAGVNFDWGTGSPGTGLPADGFSVRWTGQVEAPVAGSYTFATTSDDGVRLWVNGTQLVNNWTDHGATTDQGAALTLAAGQKYAVTMEYYENGGGAVARLLWAYPGQAQAAVPASRLFPATGGTTPPPVATGTVTREYWTGLPGVAVSIPATAPTGTSTLTSLEAPTDWADNYATRIRGYIVPATTGAYTLYIAGDDHCELWLSTSDSPSAKARIAYHTDWTTPRQWTKTGTQKSNPVTLTAGQKYYFEALHKEGGGGDNLAVGWTGPGIAAITVIGAANIAPFSPTTPPPATVAVTGVSVSPATAALTVGGTQQLAATIAPANATNKNVTWSSSNTAVATVNATGLVTAVAAGTATITVRTDDGAKTATTAVTVTAVTSGGETRPPGSTGTGFFTKNGKIYDANGNEFIPRGVNGAVFWQDETCAKNSLADVAKTKANAVRLVSVIPAKNGWSWSSRVANQRAIVQSCVANKMVPMLEFHDATCGSAYENDPQGQDLKSIVDYWVTPEVVQLCKDYERELIVNVANEWGDETVAWRDAYKTALTRMRAAGIKNMIVIDAGGNCGQNPEALRTWAAEIMAHDPQKNVAFSIHMYGFWTTADKTKASWQYSVENELQAIKNAGIPVMVGEFGWETSPDVAYNPRLLLQKCVDLGLGWFFWSWFDQPDRPFFNVVNDHCSGYRTDADLTAAGAFVVNDANLGLKRRAMMATIFSGTAPASYTLATAAANGTVARSPSQTSYTAGSTVTLTATANSGYTFSGWSGDASGSANPLTVTMNANKNITANFTATGGGTQLATLTFEPATVGNQATSYAENGYTFQDLPGSETLVVRGTADGFPSKVLFNLNFDRAIRLRRTDNAAFSLTSFRIGSDPWGGACDAVVTGTRPDGTTVTANVSGTSKSLSTVTLNWSNLSKVEINFSGGANTAFGALDDFVVSSASARLSLLEESGRVSVFPNPVAGGVLAVRILLPAAEKVQVEVFSLAGKRLLSLTRQLPQGEQTLHMPLQGMAAGMYLVKVRSTQGQVTRKIVVE